MTHPDLFRNWRDAVLEADRRAALTRLRYRVRYDRGNRWWNITETVQAVRS